MHGIIHRCSAATAAAGASAGCCVQLTPALGMWCPSWCCSPFQKKMLPHLSCDLLLLSCLGRWLRAISTGMVCTTSLQCYQQHALNRLVWAYQLGDLACCLDVAPPHLPGPRSGSTDSIRSASLLSKPHLSLMKTSNSSLGVAALAGTMTQVMTNCDSPSSYPQQKLLM